MASNNEGCWNEVAKALKHFVVRLSVGGKIGTAIYFTELHGVYMLLSNEHVFAPLVKTLMKGKKKLRTCNFVPNSDQGLNLTPATSSTT